jgi:hypothetical protein
MRYDSLTGRKQWMHKDELDAQNIRRSNISEAKGRKRPLDLCIPPNKRKKKRLKDSRAPGFVNLTGAVTVTGAI